MWRRKVNEGDCEYQIWKRESLSVERFTPAVYYLKLEYIYSNPVRAGFCKFWESITIHWLPFMLPV